jgi:hypothetical protein
LRLPKEIREKFRKAGSEGGKKGGSKGGKIGGKRRMESLTPEQRKDLARAAGIASGKARRKRKD